MHIYIYAYSLWCEDKVPHTLYAVLYFAIENVNKAIHLNKTLLVWG